MTESATPSADQPESPAGQGDTAVLSVAPAPSVIPVSAEAPPARTPDVGAAIDRALTSWLGVHLRDSPLSRNTPAWNWLQSKLGALKASLVKEISGQ